MACGVLHTIAAEALRVVLSPPRSMLGGTYSFSSLIGRAQAGGALKKFHKGTNV